MHKSLIDKVTEKRQQMLDIEARGATVLAGLCQGEAYKYLQLIASQIEAEYKCKPTDPNWHVYSTIGYAYGTLFAKVAAEARKAKENPTSNSILAEIQNKHGN